MVLVIIVTLIIAANVYQALALGYVLYSCENQSQPCSPATHCWQLPGFPLLSGCPLFSVRMLMPFLLA